MRFHERGRMTFSPLSKQTAVFAAVFVLLCFNACFAGAGQKAENKRLCGVCGKPVGESWVMADGKPYHPACFKSNIELRCKVCGKPINGVYAKDSQGVYHETCYKNTRLERCMVCNLPIEGDHLVDAWGQSAHHEHQGKPVMLCDSCGRILCAASENGFRYKDGRVICGLCNKTAVNSAVGIPAMVKDLAKLLGSVGITAPSIIPVTLVDRKTLIRESRGSDKENTRGFTKTVVRLETGKAMTFSHRIFILHGLPRTEFKGVLAHEMIHVWLNENRVKMTPRETEGFCNLGIHLVNQHERSDFSRVLQNQLEQDDDAVYGEGYRIMKAKLDAMGWEKLVEWVRGNAVGER